MDKVILSTLTIEEFNNAIREIVKEEVSKLQSIQPTSSADTEKLLTRREVKEMLNISFPTLSDWTRKGTLKGYYIGTRIRYKPSEVKEAMRLIHK